MLNRRTILKVGATAVTGALVNLAGVRRSVAAVRPAFSHAIFDERFSECRAFAVALNSTGADISGIRGDVAGLWYNDLRAKLIRNPVPFAGMTDRTALFCLEELVRDVNMRVIFRADHLTDETVHTRHSGVGPAPLVAAAGNLSTDPGFGGTMARAISSFDQNLSVYAAAQKRTGPFAPLRQTALVSWILG